MITRVPLRMKNKDSIKMVKSMAIKMVKITIKTYKSTEYSDETFENVILIYLNQVKFGGVHDRRCLRIKQQIDIKY